MSKHLLRAISVLNLILVSFYLQAQTTNSYTTPTTWTVPAGVTSLTIKVWGGGGGTGGQDCGAGCSNAAAGPAGYVEASFTVTPGDVIGIYPGAKGANGGNSVSGAGSGAGGADSYPSGNYNGGNGGNAGPSGSSGGGGGGGAASIITINSTIKIVAGGAGGGGGMANMANSGYAGVSSASSNAGTTGGNGTSPAGDGGGGGGGGGGQFASAGGNVHAAGGESAGDGGFIGGNSVSGASSIITNGNTSWANGGQVEITYLSTLPVTWLGFTAIYQNKTVVLNWSTSYEQNTRDYLVQRSTNSTNWVTIGTVTAAGNSTTVRQYNFTDPQPAMGVNYYRLLQRDADNNARYSKVIVVNVAESAASLKVYPNPVMNGTVAISLTEPATVRVYNTSGLKMLEQSFAAGAHSLNVSAFSAGTYYLKINNEGAMFVIQQ